MDEMNVSEMTIEESEEKLDELKERLVTEDLSEDERAEIEKAIRMIQDQLEVLTTKAYQAAREAARLDPEQPRPMY